MKDWPHSSPSLRLYAVASWEGKNSRKWWSGGNRSTYWTRLSVQVTHQKLIKASLSSESPFTLCSTTFAPSWMWNTGRGWSSTSRSSHSWGVLRLRRRWPTWKWSLLSVRRIWPNLSQRERSWKPKWFLCFRRRMTCVFRFTLWVNTLCNNAFLSRCQICMHAWTYDEPSGWRIMPDKSE